MKYSLIFVAAALSALVLVAAQSTTPKQASETEALTKMLEALTKAQERQAVAWEKLAEKGWPTPANYTLTGNVPSFVNVGLSGTVQVTQPGLWTVRSQ